MKKILFILAASVLYLTACLDNSASYDNDNTQGDGNEIGSSYAQKDPDTVYVVDTLKKEVIKKDTIIKKIVDTLVVKETKKDTVIKKDTVKIDKIKTDTLNIIDTLVVEHTDTLVITEIDTVIVHDTAFVEHYNWSDTSWSSTEFSDTVRVNDSLVVYADYDLRDSNVGRVLSAQMYGSLNKNEQEKILKNNFSKNVKFDFNGGVGSLQSYYIIKNGSIEKVVHNDQASYELYPGWLLYYYKKDLVTREVDMHLSGDSLNKALFYDTTLTFEYYDSTYSLNGIVFKYTPINDAKESVVFIEKKCHLSLERYYKNIEGGISLTTGPMQVSTFLNFPKYIQEEIEKWFPERFIVFWETEYHYGVTSSGNWSSTVIKYILKDGEVYIASEVDKNRPMCNINYMSLL